MAMEWKCKMINGLHVFFCHKQSLELDLCKEIIVRSRRWVNSPVLEEFVHLTPHQLPHSFHATSSESSTITQWQIWNMPPRIHLCVLEMPASYLLCAWWDTPAGSLEWVYSTYRPRPKSSQTSPQAMGAGPCYAKTLCSWNPSDAGRMKLIFILSVQSYNTVVQSMVFKFKSCFCIFQLEKEMATHSSILAWRIPWTEEPSGLQSMGSQRVGHD